MSPSPTIFAMNSLSQPAVQPDRPVRSFVLHERARQHHWAGSGSLSIKSFYGGQALYRVGGGQALVGENQYFVVNHGQPYQITIDSVHETESFCVFFAPGLAEAVYQSLTTPLGQLLNDPAASAAPVHFFEKVYPRDDIVSPMIQRLRLATSQECSREGWLDEQLHELLQLLLQAHHNVYREVEVLPAARAATREELYRRLHRAKDFVHATFDQPLQLRDVAHVAGLSSSHLLRTFRQLFGQTPHQYLISVRLQHAQSLLLNSNLAVTDVCFNVGFESVGSFSWLFRRRFGVSPDTFRRLNK